MDSPATLPLLEPTYPSTLAIRLLGDFALIYGEEPIIRVNTPRLQALLAYLLLHRQAPQSRRRLAFLFWPDSSEAQALTNLRKHLLHLKGALPDADQLLLSDRHTVHWLPQVAVKCDVSDFQQAFAQAESAESHRSLLALRQAIALYQGELLPGCYDEWILPLREELQGQYFSALERLSGLLEDQRHYDEAIQTSQRMLRFDSLYEPTYWRLMQLHALKGDRAAALRIYHTCVTQLREELGVDPDKETQGAYERLLYDTPLATAQPELAAHTAFVGRQPEWQKLQQRWRIALRGQPQFVLIAGEAGIGKTRLAEELLSWATHQGFCTVRSRCYVAEGRLTYAPVIEWLRSEKLRLQRAKIEANWLTELARLLPEILNEYPSLSLPAPITQSWQRHHLFEAAMRALFAVNQPLLLLIDDLQWCDKETLELLHFLLRNAMSLSQPKLMLLGTARLPDEVDATHPLHELLNPLRGSDTLTQLDLARLTEAETGELARQMVDRTLDAGTLQQLFNDTAGNPLFVVETLRATQAQITPNGSTDKATPATILPIAASEAIVQHLPPKVLAVIQARLGQLSSTARELCAWAAIVGRAFTLDLLTGASKIAPDKAVNALDELWQRRIIREQGSDAYDFSHDRIRDVAAAGISRVRRRYLHRCVAEALENEHTSQLANFAAQIAAHYDAAGIVEKAIHYHRLAADRAPQVYATDETVAHLQRAIALLQVLPESEERDQRELTLLIALGPPLADVTSFSISRLRPIYERAYMLSQETGIPLHPIMLRILAIHELARLNFVNSQQMGQQLLALAEREDNRNNVVYLEGCYVLSVTAFWQGHFNQARYYLQQVVDTYALVRQEHHITEYGQDTGIYCRARLGWTLWYLGYPDQARQQCEAAVVLAQALNHPYTLYIVSAYSAWCAFDERNTDQAKVFVHLFNQSKGTAATQKEDQFGFFAGWLSLLRGGIDESLKHLIKFTTSWSESNAIVSSYPQAFVLLAEAYQQVGDYAQGLVAIAEAFAALGNNQDYWYIVEMYRLKGELLMGQGKEVVNAEACFQQALEIARRQQAKSLELRAAMSLARMWVQQGKRSQAKTLLTEIYSWFTEGFDTPDLQEAKTLLIELGPALAQ